MMSGYPKVYNAGRAEVSEVLNGDVVIEEKLDGSQFSFSNDNGTLKVRSHHAELLIENPGGMFKDAVEFVKKQFEAGKVPVGLVFRGEAFRGKKHNLLEYGKVPEGNVAIFDIQDPDGAFLNRKEKVGMAQHLGFDVVAAVYEGPGDAITQAMLDGFMALKSFLGGTQVEGIVVKNCQPDGGVMLAKIVGDKFREEMKSSKRTKVKIGQGPIEALVTEMAKNLSNEARWNKAILHLEEQGKIKHDKSDIGEIIKEVQADILSENKLIEKAQEKALEIIQRTFRVAASAGIAPWYIQKIGADTLPLKLTEVANV